MGDSQDTPFISNPFMRGKPKDKPKSTPPEPAAPSKPAKVDSPVDKMPLSIDPPSKPPANQPTTATGTKSTTSTQKPPRTGTKTSRRSPSRTTKSRSKSKATQRTSGQSSNPPVSVSQPTSGYKVQVLARIPLPTNTNMPSRDYLWFAVYPIIPRVGDCIFHDGRYFRVDAVFLYENTNAGWCADIEVSYYTRRQ